MEARLSVPKSNNDNPNMTYTALHTNRARNAPHRNPVLICFSFQDVAREGGDASWCEKETQELRRSTQHWGTTHLFLKPDFDWVHCSQCLLRILCLLCILQLGPVVHRNPVLNPFIKIVPQIV